MMSAEDQFDKLAEELADTISERAAAVKCSPEEYRDGLGIILLAIGNRINDDVRASKETDDQWENRKEIGPSFD